MTPRLPTLPLVTLLLILFGLLSSYYGAYAATSAQDIAAYLAAHNGVRAQHGATALAWNQTLADAGQRWVDNCKFQTRAGRSGPTAVRLRPRRVLGAVVAVHVYVYHCMRLTAGCAENLAAGTGGSYDVSAAVKSWTDEVSQYDPQNPAPSHFTQVVWKSSMQVGCAEQGCNGIFPPNTA
uniref:Repressed by TUP1 protein 4 n=1 Tax=Ganoderma boninense TaxID=34458 RepID=A0A5K1JWT7_9APHY|nr:Repressed by TUP1 protein 4 [Ganoderma boninense]